MLTNEMLNIIIDLPQPSKERVINVIDFGASTDPSFCNQQAFQQAIDYCKETGASQLLIPNGVYYFQSPPPGDAFLTFDGLTDFTVDGCGSELRFGYPKMFTKVINCHRVRLHRLVLDWNWEVAPLASVGVVTNVEEDGAYFDMEFPAYIEIPDQWRIHIVGPFNPVRYTPGTTGGIEYRPYKNEHPLLSEQAETDAEMQKLVRELSNIILGMEKIDSNTMRFYASKPAWTAARIKPGQCYNLRHYEYDTVAVFLFDSSHITVDRVTIYSCPGSGFVGNGAIHHIHLDHCKITQRPGTDRPISTSVDCFHIANSKGHFIIEDCEFGYAGDDCINIHDNTSMGVKRVDHHTLTALRVRKNSLLFQVGDILELRNPDLSPMQFSSPLVGVSYNEDEHTCTLTFEDVLPELLDENSVLFNRRFSTDHFIIRNNRFTHNRARGILIHGSHGIVEHNLFENIQGAAIQIESGCESRWSEGTGVKQVAIRHNIFRNCDLNAWQMAVIYMGVYLPGGRTPYPIFSDIWIEHNTIVNSPRMAMFLSSCRNITVQGNTIINANQVPLKQHHYGSSQEEAPIYDEVYRGTIHLLHASDVTIANNKCFSTTTRYESGIYADADTTRNIEIAQNTGFAAD
ncbi:right-handed parallel beta-helix repeat-containing protein [Paenibacillus sp. LHD-38]|uniref:right-handed parallel beta-helix repeat-containing protein n=1 Tax=Paenibacillus sp. LHD-38 TaxID=3072143 RepID=UPI00280FCD3E|nr:right-handed parallel beta-helix repeat-containing protein [Paenibacillus sp. LHD-38]MDQ8735198.1 right-handed parallel beta-helix repeat-containing protein [Paenibacillus sp. LHD-38]